MGMWAAGRVSALDTEEDPSSKHGDRRGTDGRLRPVACPVW